MRALSFLAGAGLALVLNGAPGRAGDLDRTTDGDEVQLHLSSPLTMLPPGGDLPCRVSIHNDASVPGTWQVKFVSEGMTANLGSTTLQEDLTVPANATGTFDLLVPMPIVSVESGASALNVGISGPGFESSSLRPYFANFYSGNARGRSPFTVIGKELLNPVGLEPLESYYKDMSRQFYGSQADAPSLPEDWRGYSGVAAVFLKDNEWLELRPKQREAICNYVAQGGRLSLFTEAGDNATISGLHLPGAGSMPGDYGFGKISLVTSSPMPPTAETLHRTMIEYSAPAALEVDRSFTGWTLRHAFGTIKVDSTFIVLFVILFGTLIGPLNLFVFARGTRRFRLFWTTPLISLLASAALATGILVSDGIGGSGKQLVAIYSLPDSNQESVVQEQVARSGVLLSTRWKTTQDYLVTPVSQHALRGEAINGSMRMFRGLNIDAEDSSKKYEEDGRTMSGSWFRSRSIAGQYLQTVRPSRSVLTVLNFLEVEAGQAPQILSSFPVELTDVRIVDEKGRDWKCANLLPGVKKTCLPSSPEEYGIFWNALSDNAGGKLSSELSKATHRFGCFYAVGTPGPADVLETISDIRWQPASGIYLGPWVAGAAREKGP